MISHVYYMKILFTSIYKIVWAQNLSFQSLNKFMENSDTPKSSRIE